MSRFSTEPPSRPGCRAIPADRVVLRREAVAALGPDADPIRAGTMLEQLGRALWTNGETEAALKAHEEAVAIMPADPPTPARARVLSGYGQILMLLDRWTESLALCEQAVAMAREVGARQVEGHALNTLGLDRAVTGDCAGSVGPAPRRRSPSPGRSPTRTTSVAGT